MSDWIRCVAVCHHLGPRRGARREINQCCVTGRCWFSWLKMFRRVVSSRIEVLWVHRVIRQLTEAGSNHTEFPLNRIELCGIGWVSYYPACLRTFNALMDLLWCQHYRCR